MAEAKHQQTWRAKSAAEGRRERTLVLTDETWTALGQIAEKRGVTRAALVADWTDKAAKKYLSAPRWPH